MRVNRHFQGPLKMKQLEEIAKGDPIQKCLATREEPAF